MTDFCTLPRSRRLLPLFVAFLLILSGGNSLRAQNEEPTPSPTPTPAPTVPAFRTEPNLQDETTLAPATPPEPAATPAPTPAAEETPAATVAPAEMAPPTAPPSEEPASTPAPAPMPTGTPVVTFKPSPEETVPVPAAEQPASLSPTPAASPAATVPSTATPEATETPASPVIRPESAASESKTTGHTLDAQDLETFLDGLIPPQLLIQDVAGATICVVKDGQVLLTKGYGYADFKARKAVSGEDTLFRPGSISKTFVAVSVMQLVESGQLNLDRNVEEYLDFRLPARAYPQALTLRQLLTHTAGFEETLRDLFVTPDEKLPSLHDYVQQDTPPQLFPPGTVTAYSNYGMALAGYVVERVSGQPFADYVATHIFGPLGMTHSTFVQPPPEPLAAAVSLGYMKAGDAKPIPFERTPAVPVGGLSATAADMGRFMLMLLNNGSLDDKRILAPESVKAMFERQHVSHDALNAMGLAFSGSAEGDRFIIGHGGDSLAFHSDLFLLPASKTGLFISNNSASGQKMRQFVRRAFLDRYFPAPPAPAPATVTDALKTDARVAAGAYHGSRRAESSFLKFDDLLSQTDVETSGDGSLTISISRDLRGHLIRWEPVAGKPLVYREQGGPRMVAFQRDPKGNINTLFIYFPGMELERVPWYERQVFVLGPLGLSLAVILATALLWPVAGIVRRRYARPAVEGYTAATFYVLTRVVCVLDAVVILAWAYLLIVVGENDTALFNGHHLAWQMPTLYILGRIAAGGGLVALAGALVFLHPKFAVRRIIRWQQWLIVAACAIFAAFAWHWHLLA